MRMLALAAIVTIAGSTTASAQTDPAAAPAPAATTHMVRVHARTITHHDGKQHPKITKVVHHDTIATPAGTATRTTTATTTTTPR